MKLARFLSLIVLASVVVFYVSCDGGGDPEKSEIDEQIEKLNGTWDATAVTLDGVAPTSQNYDDLQLVIQGAAGNEQVNYTVSGRPSGSNPWNSGGILEFGTANVKTELTREDGIAVSYSVTETTLVVDFNFSGTPYDVGRVANVSGNWHFEFVKVN